MENENEVRLDPNLKCNVCGEQKFSLREGFAYCDECGTKQEQVLDIEIEPEDDSKNFLKKQKIHAAKLEGPEVTSWEVYNYILCGLVDELISFGAKDELKLMTLQVWAAYLRRMEVAFFNIKHADLPKLGVRFIKRDARILYNHCNKKRNRRKRRRTEESGTSAACSARRYRKSKRKLDESVYSLHTSSLNSTMLSSDFTQSSSQFSSQSGVTSRAIQLKFSSQARKILKKTIPLKHLEKHEKDYEGLLKCHNIRPHSNTIDRFSAITTLKMKHLYCILAIALNLVEDTIQMSDLVRFIAEGHIGTKNLLQYFPENIVPNLDAVLADINFNLFSTKCTHKTVHEHTNILARFIKIRDFKRPDLFKLCLRYIMDLNLPPDIADYAERLINLLPPQMQTRMEHTYPAYEARAMAYLVFVLKLLFGLDGHKEKLISESAQKVNKIIWNIKNDVSRSHQPNNKCHPQLFVWSEWVEYVEMRKIIVSQYNSSFSKQFNQSQSTAQLIEEMAKAENEKYGQDDIATERLPMPTNIANMHRIFENVQQTFNGVNCRKSEIIKFSPSLTPAHSYFKRILLHSSNNNEDENKSKTRIPEFMRVVHSQRTLEPFLQDKSLRNFLNASNYQLKVVPQECTTNRSYAGIFRVHDCVRPNTQKAVYNIGEEEWLKMCSRVPIWNGLEFKTSLERYSKEYFAKLKRQLQKRRQVEDYSKPEYDQSEGPNRSINGNDDNNQNNTATAKPLSIQSMQSIEAFSELHMEPLRDLNIKAPRRDLGKVNLFYGLDTDEQRSDVINKDLQPPIKSGLPKNEITLITSKMDCWLLLGNIPYLSERQLDDLEKKLPRTFYWLLETCAQMIGVDWNVIYEQLLIIEVMFSHGIEDLDSFENCIKYKYNYPIKDINSLINTFRPFW